MDMQSITRTENLAEAIVGPYTVQGHAGHDKRAFSLLILSLAQMEVFGAQLAPIDEIGDANYGMGKNGRDCFFLNEEAGLSVRWWVPAE